MTKRRKLGSEHGRFGSASLGDSIAEVVGTAILFGVALSAATLLIAPQSPAHGWVANPLALRLAIGGVTVCAAAAVIYSPLGLRSGGHLNPAVSIGFFGLRKLRWDGAVIYIASQMAGALLGGTVVAVAFGSWARSVQFSASRPGRYGPGAALLAETAGTFVLMSILFHFVDSPRLMRLTPVAAALTTVAIIALEAPASTTSLNPARSLAPAVLSVTFSDLWIYLLGPPAGALIAATVYRATRRSVPCAKLVHTEGYQCHFQNCAYRQKPPG